MQGKGAAQLEGSVCAGLFLGPKLVQCALLRLKGRAGALGAGERKKEMKNRPRSWSRS